MKIDVSFRSRRWTFVLSAYINILLDNGKREPKLAQLKALADAYKPPLSFFLSEEAMQANIVLWRHKPESPLAEDVQVRRQTLAEQYHNVEVWCGEHEPCELPFASRPSETEFHDRDAAKLAGEFRRQFGLGERPGQSLLRVHEEEARNTQARKKLE